MTHSNIISNHPGTQQCRPCSFLSAWTARTPTRRPSSSGTPCWRCLQSYQRLAHLTDHLSEHTKLPLCIYSETVAADNLAFSTNRTYQARGSNFVILLKFCKPSIFRWCGGAGVNHFPCKGILSTWVWNLYSATYKVQCYGIYSIIDSLQI